MDSHSVTMALLPWILTCAEMPNECLRHPYLSKKNSYHGLGLRPRVKCLTSDPHRTTSIGVIQHYYTI